MTLSEFFLICFFVGLILTAISFFASGFHFHLHTHLHLHHTGAAGRQGAAMAFFIWFGGTGYLLTRYWPAAWPWIFSGATGAGATAALVIFWFVGRVLARNDRSLDPADYEMRGVLGRVSSAARAGGTGEMIFSQQGTRRAVAARNEDGAPLERGEEVIVTRFEKGVAYVRRWEES